MDDSRVTLDGSQLGLRSGYTVSPDRPYLGSYQIAERLGSGGYADVFRAIRLQDRLPVALKVMARQGVDGQAGRDRLLIEGHLAVDLVHPNLVRYLEVDEEDGVLFLAMELVDGGDATHLAGQHAGRLPWEVLARIARDVADGLQYLHDRGLVHRDVKPANLLLTRDGVCKLGDFGLIRPIVGGGSLTMAGHVVGTPDFLSPEQARGEAGVDHLVDVYGLGATMYCLATGQPPHDSPNLWTTLARTVSDPFPDPRALRPDLPDALARIIMRAGAKACSARYQRADEVSAALSAVLAGREPPAHTLPVRRAAAAGSGHGPLVLLVDDDPLVRRLYAGRLMLDGFRVEVAATAEQAIDLVQRLAPAAIVLDLYLEAVDSVAVLHSMRAVPGLAAVPVVVFSNALAEDHLLVEVQLIGVQRILAKAATAPRVLTSVLRELLSLPRHQARVASESIPIQDLGAVSRTALDHLTRLMPTLGAATSSSDRERILAGVADTARGLSAAAAATGHAAMAALSEGSEYLARRLVGEGQAVSESLHRTLIQAIVTMQRLATRQEVQPDPGWTPRPVLLIEDDPLAAKYAQRALAKVAIPVILADRDLDAINLLDRQQFALVVSNVSLGGALVAAIHRHHRHQQVPLIFVAGVDDLNGLLDEGVEADVIEKPYLMAELSVKALCHQVLTTITAPAPFPGMVVRSPVEVGLGDGTDG